MRPSYAPARRETTPRCSQFRAGGRDASDLQDAIKKQGLSLLPGDAVLIHTGWGQLWDEEAARDSVPRPASAGVAGRAADRSDTASVEVSPNPAKNLDTPVHQIALVVNGAFLLQNLKLDELACKRVQEFAFIVEPLKIRGGSGSRRSRCADRAGEAHRNREPYQLDIS